MDLWYIFKVLIFLHTFTGDEVKSDCAYKQCSDGSQHSMCIYPAKLDKSVEKCSAKEAKAGLTDKYRTDILDAHNRLRQKVALGQQQGQPEAANMMKLVWDSELEAIAQRFANECDKDGLNHDKCRNMKDGTSVGQNSAQSNLDLKTGANRTSALEVMVQMWYDDVKNVVDPSVIDSFQPSGGAVIGHYTQLVWAESSRLGCGYREENKADDVHQPVTMKCNYAVAGNILSTPIYIKGKACSKCPKGTHCSKIYTALCTHEKNEQKEVKTKHSINDPNGGAQNLCTYYALLKSITLMIFLFVF